MRVIKVEGFGRRGEDASCHNAYTGLRWDGKIYVSQVDKAFKIGKGQIS